MEKQKINLSSDFLTHKKSTDTSPGLKNILELEKLIIENASKDIVLAPPLLSLDDIPIIRRNTINIIQGKAGSHKSRLMETIASALIARNTDDSSRFIGFNKFANYKYNIAYIDTERNSSEECPFALQRIRKLAGYNKTDILEIIRFFSLKMEKRTERKDKIKHLLPLFIKGDCCNIIFVDVVTDCVASFNNESESLELLDFFGQLAEENDCTFILAIHENPGTEKARGHVGTEVLNKSSAVLQIGFEGPKPPQNEFLKLNFLKTRSIKRPDPILLRYSDVHHRLVLADEHDKAILEASKQKSAPTEKVVLELGKVMEKKIHQKDLLEVLAKTFDVSSNTILTRIDAICKNEDIVNDYEGKPCHLIKDHIKGGKTFYHLAPTLAPNQNNKPI